MKSNRKTIIFRCGKSFYKVNQDFLFSTLHKFGFGTSFIRWIEILYSLSIASIIINDVHSCHCYSQSLQNHQQKQCQNDKITGISTHTIVHKISLYADDVLLFLQDHTLSIKETTKLIISFSHISDYSVNWNKSRALSIGDCNWNAAL